MRLHYRRVISKGTSSHFRERSTRDLDGGLLLPGVEIQLSDQVELYRLCP
jgi:hypothetical protein